MADKRHEPDPVIERYWIASYLREAQEWLARAEARLEERGDGKTTT